MMREWLYTVSSWDVLYTYTAERRDVLGIGYIPDDQEISRGPRDVLGDISRSEEMYNPIHPDLRQWTDTIWPTKHFVQCKRPAFHIIRFILKWKIYDKKINLLCPKYLKYSQYSS